ALTRASVGEWIFSHALFDWPAEKDRQYIDEVLLKPPTWLKRNPTPPPSRSEVRAIRKAAAIARSFIGECADRLAAMNPRVVGFTSVFQQQLASLALASELKARLPEVAIVMGGANCEATMGAETVRQFSFVDAVVSGEADTVFGDLVARIVARQPFDDIPGVLTRATADAALSGGRLPATS